MHIKNTRNRFRSITKVKEIKDENLLFLDNLNKLIALEISEAVIAYLPDNEGDLYIDNYKIKNIIEKHGELPRENLIITATEPTTIIKGVIQDRPYITLLYEFEKGGFVLSARKFNSHYVVTFFEPTDMKYLESLKRRGVVTLTEKKTP